MAMHRRDLILATLAAGLPAAKTAHAAGEELPEPFGKTWLAVPDLRLTSEVRYASGVRPRRTDGFLLAPEPTPIAGKTIIHNYGHGGGGITLSWGCAQLVKGLIGEGKSEPVAVIGAGIIGLTTAVHLQRRGHKVRVYAERVSSGRILQPVTTSDVAGGQWSPSISGLADSSSAFQLQNFAAACKASYAMFDTVRQTPGGYVIGVNNFSFRRSVTQDPWDELRVIKDVSGTGPFEVDVLPFAAMNRLRITQTVRGTGYRTMLINVPNMITQLKAELGAAIVMEPRYFDTPAEFGALPEAIVVNCTGLGSRKLFGDKKVEGVKGLLALLPKMPNLPVAKDRYLFSGTGYLFPRSDVTIVGGMVEELGDQSDALCARGVIPFHARANDVERSRMILRIMDAVMNGALPVRSDPLGWFSGKENLVLEHP